MSAADTAYLIRWQHSDAVARVGDSLNQLQPAQSGYLRWPSFDPAPVQRIEMLNNKIMWRATTFQLLCAMSCGAQTWKDDDIVPLTCPPDYEWKPWNEGFITGSTGKGNPQDGWSMTRGKGEDHTGKGLSMPLTEGKGNSERSTWCNYCSIASLSFVSDDTAFQSASE